MKKVLLLAFVVSFFILGNGSAQTVHVINFSNTIDKKIGISCEVDYERVKQETGLIAAYLDYGIKYYSGKGNDCSNENLMNTLNSLRCNKDDIILFFYSGHGARSSQDKSEFPQMCLKYSGYEQDKFVAVHTVIEKLKAKGARFTLVMADCCNAVGPGVVAKSLMSRNGGMIVYDKDMARCYRKLFLDNKGLVAATGCKKGQCSLGNDAIGGFFSDAFFGTALYKACRGEIPATWEKVLGTAASIVKDMTKTVEIQEPYYEINLKPSSTPTPPAPTPTPPAPPVIAAKPDFASEMATLLDASHTEEWRLKQGNYVADKYFTSNAKVVMVGRNGTTILKNESALYYLRQLARSETISKINIINEKTDATGKHSYIKVQEIRKPK